MKRLTDNIVSPTEEKEVLNATPLGDWTGSAALTTKICENKDDGELTLAGHKRQTPEISKTSAMKAADKAEESKETPLPTYAAGTWSKDEHEEFIAGLLKFGNNWLRVSAFIGTRSRSQVVSHTQKYFDRRRKEGLKKIEAMLVKPLFLITREYRNTTSIMQRNPHELIIDPNLKRERQPREDQNKTQMTTSAPLHSTPKPMCVGCTCDSKDNMVRIERPRVCTVKIEREHEIKTLSTESQEGAQTVSLAAVAAIDKLFAERIWPAQCVGEEQANDLLIL
jgi:SHAQKYF class myb-like DNA-binding protein